MRELVTAWALLGIGVAMCGCSGNGYSSGGGNPVGPTPPSSASGIVTINVVAINGAQSFSPNPATVPSGQMVVWHNVDSITHHVVLNDGSVDTGDLAAGASSQPMTIGSGAPYHCSIHPVMVGSINQNPSLSSPPPCQGAYCD
jgi:plastocyanin